MSKKGRQNVINKPLEKEFGVYDASAVFIGAYIVMLLLQFLFYIVLTITKVPTGGEDGFDTTVAYACITVVINELAFLSAPFLYSKIKSRKVYLGSGLAEKVKPVYLALAALVGILTLFAFAPAATLINSGFSALGFTGSTAPSATSIGELIAYVCVSALLPAFCEEFLFRGHVARGFSGKGYLFGVLASSALFAVMHGSPIQLVYQFFLGAVCSLLVIFTRSLWTSVIVHFISNLAVLLLDYGLTSAGIDYVTLTGASAGIMVGTTVAGIAALVALMYLIYRMVIKERGIEGEVRAVKGANPKAWNMRLALIAEDEEKRAKRREEQAFRASQIQNAATPEVREMLMQRYESEDKKTSKTDTRALIFCFAFPVVIFILNTILGFVE